MNQTIPNPLRMLGIARVLAGALFVAAGLATLRQYPDLLPQAERLFGPDSGTTGAPIRSLLMLVLAAVLVLIGLGLTVLGFAWMRRVAVPPEGPSAIDRDEAVAALRDHRLLTFAEAPTAPYWPLRRWLADELAEMTWWRREIASDGVRAFVRICGFTIAFSVLCFVLPRIMTDDLVGPFPVTFVIVFPFVGALWAVLGLILFASTGPRVESVELALPPGAARQLDLRNQQVIESHPTMLDRESPALALTLGVAGIAVQCLMLPWWNLSPIDYPLRATALIRDAGSIAGGVVFFALGGRMVAAARKLLPVFRYESMLVLIDPGEHGLSTRAAAIRTESRGLAGPRQVVAAVGGTYVRESAERLMRERAGAV